MSFSPNFFVPVEFRVLIKRLPNVQFFTQQTSIPNISANPIIQSTRFNPVFQQGDMVTYGNLDLTFIVDEEMKNYMEIFNWITGFAFPQNHEQFKNIKESRDGLFSDIQILVMNSKKNANIEINFKNCFPIGLSDVSLDVTNQDVTYPQATATFQYDSYNINKFEK